MRKTTQKVTSRFSIQTNLILKQCIKRKLKLQLKWKICTKIEIYDPYEFICTWSISTNKNQHNIQCNFKATHIKTFLGNTVSKIGEMKESDEMTMFAYITIHIYPYSHN